MIKFDYSVLVENIDIKRATLNDLNQLRTICRQTFLESFSADNDEENMAMYLAESFSLKKLGSELSSPGSEFYFALHDDEVIGYLKINSGESQTDIKDNKSLEIERIYVLKQHQGKKVGQMLFDKAMQLATQKQAEYVWLGVWEKNTKAIRFYTKNGFREFNTHIFKLGEDEQTDLMMKKVLWHLGLPPPYRR